MKPEITRLAFVVTARERAFSEWPRSFVHLTKRTFSGWPRSFVHLTKRTFSEWPRSFVHTLQIERERKSAGNVTVAHFIPVTLQPSTVHATGISLFQIESESESVGKRVGRLDRIMSSTTGPATVAANAASSKGVAAHSTQGNNLGHIIKDAVRPSLVGVTTLDIDEIDELHTPNPEPEILPGTVRRVDRAITGHVTGAALITRADFAVLHKPTDLVC